MFAFHINISEHFGHAAWFLQRIILSFQRTPSDMPFLRLQQPSTSIFECQVFHFNGKLQVLICAQNTQLWASSWKMLFVPLSWALIIQPNSVIYTIWLHKSYLCVAFPPLCVNHISSAISMLRHSFEWRIASPLIHKNLNMLPYNFVY